MTSQLRSRLAQIERDMHFHETQLALLRTQHEEIERHLCAIAVYPILTLPNEITSEIFIQWVYARKKHNPMLLTWVCKLWRVVVISTPQIWARLKNMPRKEFLAEWLSRTGSLPLKLDMRFRSGPRAEYQDSLLYGIISRHPSQWEMLDLASNAPVTLPRGPFPRLTSLAVSGITDFYRPVNIVDSPPLIAPRLRELILEYSSELGNALHPYFPCMQLTSLELEADAVECLKFLAHTSNLEHFTVKCEGGHFPDLETWDFITIPRLLSIHCAGSTDPTLLQYLTLPALEELSFSLSSDWTEIVQALMARSQCSIRQLDLNAYLADYELLREFLALPGLQSVRALTLRSADGRDHALDNLFLKIAQDCSFLPLLESFAVHDCEFFISIGTVVDMLCARMNSKVKLKSFQLILGRDYDVDGRDNAQIDLWDGYVPGKLDTLAGLRSQGLQVDIRSKFRFWNHHIDPSIIEAIRRDNTVEVDQ